VKFSSNRGFFSQVCRDLVKGQYRRVVFADLDALVTGDPIEDGFIGGAKTR
jgi:hypothetical protein